MARAKPLYYADDEVYDVQLGDEVEFNDMSTGPLTYCGEITAIYPKKRQVRIRYRDEDDWTKKTAEPKVKVATVALASVTCFVARVM